MSWDQKAPEFTKESVYKITKEVDLNWTDIVNKKKYIRRLYFMGILACSHNTILLCKSCSTQYALYTIHTDLLDDKKIKDITKSGAFDRNIDGLFNLVLFNSRIMPGRYEVE